MKKWKRILLTMLGFILVISLAMGYIILAAHIIETGNPILGWGMGGVFMLGVIFVAARCCVEHESKKVKS